MTCYMTPGSYTTVTLSKVKDTDTSEVLAVFHNDGSTDVVVDRETTTNRVAEQGVSMMTLTLINAGCDDTGTYTCSHDNGQSGSGDVLMRRE